MLELKLVYGLGHFFEDIRACRAATDSQVQDALRNLLDFDARLDFLVQRIEIVIVFVNDARLRRDQFDVTHFFQWRRTRRTGRLAGRAARAVVLGDELQQLIFLRRFELRQSDGVLGCSPVRVRFARDLRAEHGHRRWLCGFLFLFWHCVLGSHVFHRIFRPILD